MGFSNLGFSEILVIAIVILLLFGARRIPEVLGDMGSGIREFKRSLHDDSFPAATASEQTARGRFSVYIAGAQHDKIRATPKHLLDGTLDSSSVESRQK